MLWGRSQITTLAIRDPSPVTERNWPQIT